ncbi:hypothetical protein E4O86_03785 [Rhizobiales bacterium L72]|uniref:LPS-assembly lipoprotein n=1 Tax=Propylenella binzhouense TaxID=2555902 RepID=A0A964WSG3_9HYPH|nr:LPS assembly lipoprotein LptE [Propylenella binzhouense]MYZ46836.1 hypothetical protein [Propylenella binzhouense]
MSWLRPLAALAVTLALAGCQVRPLYATPPDGVGAAQALPAIAVDPPLNRPEQVFRNRLLFGLRGGGEGAANAYSLGYRLILGEAALGVEPVTGTPASYQIIGNLSFILKDARTGAALVQDRVTSMASFNRSTQDFANIRARRDAEDRVSETLAELVEVRLAAFFAER